MVLAGSGETNLVFGLTTPPAQPPDEMGALMVSPGPLPIILPPQISRIALKPNHFYYPPAALPGAPLGPQMLALGTVLRVW